MDALVSRQYQINKLGMERTHKLHSWEKRNKAILTPAEIFEKGNLDPTGDVDSVSQVRLFRLIKPIYDDKEREVMDEEGTVVGIENAIEITHRVDLEVARRCLDFSASEKKSSVMDKMKSFKESAPY